VAVVLVFIDHTIMIEHRTDAQLCAKSDLDEALDLLENIMKNIRKFKDDTILFFLPTHHSTVKFLTYNPFYCFI